MPRFDYLHEQKPAPQPTPAPKPVVKPGRFDYLNQEDDTTFAGNLARGAVSSFETTGQNLSRAALLAAEDLTTGTQARQAGAEAERAARIAAGAPGTVDILSPESRALRGLGDRFPGELAKIEADKRAEAEALRQKVAENVQTIEAARAGMAPEPPRGAGGFVGNLGGTILQYLNPVTAAPAGVAQATDTGIRANEAGFSPLAATALGAGHAAINVGLPVAAGAGMAPVTNAVARALTPAVTSPLLATITRGGAQAAAGALEGAPIGVGMHAANMGVESVIDPEQAAAMNNLPDWLLAAAGGALPGAAMRSAGSIARGEGAAQARDLAQAKLEQAQRAQALARWTADDQAGEIRQAEARVNADAERAAAAEQAARETPPEAEPPAPKPAEALAAQRGELFREDLAKSAEEQQFADELAAVEKMMAEDARRAEVEAARAAATPEGTERTYNDVVAAKHAEELAAHARDLRAAQEAVTQARLDAERALDQRRAVEQMRAEEARRAEVEQARAEATPPNADRALLEKLAADASTPVLPPSEPTGVRGFNEGPTVKQPAAKPQPAPMASSVAGDPAVRAAIARLNEVRRRAPGPLADRLRPEPIHGFNEGPPREAPQPLKVDAEGIPVPSGMPKPQRKALADAGYTKADIEGMTPEQRQAALAKHAPELVGREAPRDVPPVAPDTGAGEAPKGETPAVAPEAPAKEPAPAGRPAEAPVAKAAEKPVAQAPEPAKPTRPPEQIDRIHAAAKQINSKATIHDDHVELELPNGAKVKVYDAKITPEQVLAAEDGGHSWLDTARQDPGVTGLLRRNGVSEGTIKRLLSKNTDVSMGAWKTLAVKTKKALIEARPPEAKIDVNGKIITLSGPAGWARLAHEVGHRQWYKQMTDAERAALLKAIGYTGDAKSGDAAEAVQKWLDDRSRQVKRFASAAEQGFFFKARNFALKTVNAVRQMLGLQPVSSLSNAWRLRSKPMDEGPTAEQVYERYAKNEILARPDRVEAAPEGDRFALRDEEIRTGTFFSGGGTIEAGLKTALGSRVKHAMAVEYVPAIADAYAEAHGVRPSVRSVHDVTPQEFIDSGANYFHASPVCKNFSAAKRSATVDAGDMESARSVSRVITEAKPPVVTIENVPAYEDTVPYKHITDALTSAGYKWDVVNHDAADFGGASHRKRIIVRATLEGELPPVPAKTQPGDWFATIKDLLVSKDLDGVPAWEQARIDRMAADGRLDLSKPYITMGGSTSATTAAAANAGRPAPTLKSTPAEVPRVVMPDGSTYRVTGRMMARLMGLPDSYPVPEGTREAKVVLGNGIHGATTKALVAPLFEKPTADRYSLADEARSPEMIARQDVAAKADEGRLADEELRQRAEKILADPKEIEHIQNLAVDPKASLAPEQTRAINLLADQATKDMLGLLGEGEKKFNLGATNAREWSLLRMLANRKAGQALRTLRDDMFKRDPLAATLQPLERMTGWWADQAEQAMTMAGSKNAKVAAAGKAAMADLGARWEARNQRVMAELARSGFDLTNPLLREAVKGAGPEQRYALAELMGEVNRAVSRSTTAKERWARTTVGNVLGDIGTRAILTIRSVYPQAVQGLYFGAVRAPMRAALESSVGNLVKGLDPEVVAGFGGRANAARELGASLINGIANGFESVMTGRSAFNRKQMHLDEASMPDAISEFFSPVQDWSEQINAPYLGTTLRVGYGAGLEAVRFMDEATRSVAYDMQSRSLAYARKKAGDQRSIDEIRQDADIHDDAMAYAAEVAANTPLTGKLKAAETLRGPSWGKWLMNPLNPLLPFFRSIVNVTRLGLTISPPGGVIQATRAGLAMRTLRSPERLAAFAGNKGISEAQARRMLSHKVLEGATDAAIAVAVAAIAYALKDQLVAPRGGTEDPKEARIRNIAQPQGQLGDAPMARMSPFYEASQVAAVTRDIAGGEMSAMAGLTAAGRSLLEKQYLTGVKAALGQAYDPATGEKITAPEYIANQMLRMYVPTLMPNWLGTAIRDVSQEKATRSVDANDPGGSVRVPVHGLTGEERDLAMGPGGGAWGMLRAGLFGGGATPGPDEQAAAKLIVELNDKVKARYDAEVAALPKGRKPKDNPEWWPAPPANYLDDVAPGMRDRLSPAQVEDVAAAIGTDFKARLDRAMPRIKAMAEKEPERALDLIRQAHLAAKRAGEEAAKRAMRTTARP